MGAMTQDFEKPAALTPSVQVNRPTLSAQAYKRHDAAFQRGTFVLRGD